MRNPKESPKATIKLAKAKKKAPFVISSQDVTKIIDGTERLRAHIERHHESVRTVRLHRAELEIC